MTYEELLTGIKWTEERWRRLGTARSLPPQFHYESLRRRGYWLNLEQMALAQLSRDVITGFLNTAEWCCHLPGPGKPAKHQTMLRDLKGAVNNVSPYYQAIKRLKLVDLDFMATTSLNSQSLPVAHVIPLIYNEYCAIRPQFGRVAASKLMHMALPELFMMWDNAIIKGYGVPHRRSDLSGRINASYLPFLILMQENAKHVKATSGAGLSMGWPDFVDYVSVHCGSGSLATMTRLLDIANYSVGHLSAGGPDIRCRECCNRANALLPRVELLIEQYTGVRARLGRFGEW